MAGRLAAVPELSIAGFTAPSPPRHVYRESIRRLVVVSGGYIRPTFLSQSIHSGSSASSASNSCTSNNSCISSSFGLVSPAAADLGTHELTKIARQMVSDGYTQRLVQAFEYGGGTGPGSSLLQSWLFELDVDWVLQIRKGRGSREQLQLQDKSSSWLRELVERWIRALIITVISIKEVAIAVGETQAVARFGKASITEMLVFIDAMAPVLKEEKLRAVLDMYICVSSASHMFTLVGISTEAQITFNDIRRLLVIQVNRLSIAIHNTMKEVRALMEDNASWQCAMEIPRGKGGVHWNVRLMVNCIESMDKARHHNNGHLGGLIDDSVHYLKDLLLRKSELCWDPRLKYLFLLNNLYFVALLVEPWPRYEWRPTPECEKYMNSYLDVSWGPVESLMPHVPKTAFMDEHLDDGNLDDSWGRGHVSLFCIPKMVFHGLLHRWKDTSSLAKFESAFHKTYQAQKFWQVPNPRLRDALRKAIIERVITGYRNYLEEHPELEKHVSGGSSSPDVLEEMLGELFEG